MISQFITQKTFRSLLDAMSRPGKVVDLQPENVEKSNSKAYLLQIAETLMDHETSFCCLGYSTNGLAEEVYSATKCRCVEHTMADYIIITGGSSNQAIREAKTGTPAFPDDNATLVYLADGFDPADTAIRLTLQGPGINGQRDVYLDGVNPDEINTIRDLNRAFPQGVDCIFLDGNGKVMCLPRSTKIEWEK